MKRTTLIFMSTCLFAVFLFAACRGNKKGDDLLKQHEVKIAVDATFRPIMEMELDLFAKTHLDAILKPIYCSEDSAIQLLLNDSVRTIVVTRKLTANEQERLRKHRLSGAQSLIATDAFALIVNKNNPDTLIRVDEIRKIVSGQITHWNQLEKGSKKSKIHLVFDDSRSSTVRYMRDSLCGGKPLKGNLFAQGSNMAVIQAVKDNPDAIGVVGTDWLRGDNATVLPNFDHLDIKVMLVTASKEQYPQYYRPYQYNIAMDYYPLTRSVYVISTDPHTNSQAKYLYFFLKGQKGQLIFCNNSQLLPSMQVQVRDVFIH